MQSKEGKWNGWNEAGENPPLAAATKRAQKKPQGNDLFLVWEWILPPVIRDLGFWVISVIVYIFSRSYLKRSLLMDVCVN